MKILLCGGGTGGHITPILAVAHEIKRVNPEAYIIYVGEHGGKFSHLVKNVTSIDETRTVYGGKLRRYHNQSWIKRILDVKTNLLNIRDLFYVLLGYFQSRSIIRKENPSAIFIKGGYIGLPVGLAAASKKIPYITHDSDANESLTTRIIGKWAMYHATGMPTRLYSYPQDKTRYVGVPVASEFEYVTDTLKQEYRSDLNIPKNAKMLLITGGSLGATRLNNEISKIIPELFEQINDLFVVHQVGKGNLKVYGKYENKQLIVAEFIQDLYKYTGAADVIIARSGATTVAELAIQAKPLILIPNPELTGGHQTKNANSLSDKDASIVITENKLKNDPDHLLNVLVELMNDTNMQLKLSENLHNESVQDSANKIAVLLLSLVN